MYMSKGDLILTDQCKSRLAGGFHQSDAKVPDTDCEVYFVVLSSVQWHDHGNDGNDPVIWLDGLDMPMFAGTFPVNFQVRMMQHPDYNGQRYHDSV